jgi:hypothetical protein
MEIGRLCIEPPFSEGNGCRARECVIANNNTGNEGIVPLLMLVL